MAASKHPGIFIVIEGVDGAGKTSIAQRLIEKLNEDTAFLQQHNYAGAIYLREPGSTNFGNGVRQLFLDGNLAPMTEVLSLMAVKNQLLEEQIRPAVYGGWIVVCDRYTRTLLAYQGGLRGIPMPTLVSLLATSGLLIPPNLELFLNVTADVSLQRRGAALNSFDTLAEARAEDLRQGFRDAKEALPPYRSIDIDASGSFDSVFETVHAEVKRYLKFHRSAGRTLPEPILSYTPEQAPVLIEPAKPEVAVEPKEESREPELTAGDSST